MSNTVICSNGAPAAIGPYSQAIRTGNLLFTSGQLGLDPETGMLRNGIREQTVQALASLDAILQEAGFSRKHVIKTLVFLKSMSDYAAVNEIYADFFGSHKPARSCIEVAQLPKGGLVEIEAVAAL